VRVRPLEVKALVPLLEQDWETPEALAESLIQALDSVRASRTSYVAVMQFGRHATVDDYGFKKAVWYAGMGPYPGQASARKAATSHPGAGMASAIAVIPVLSATGVEQMMKEVG